MRKEVAIAITLFAIIAFATIYYIIQLGSKKANGAAEQFLPQETILVYKTQNIAQDFDKWKSSPIAEDLVSTPFYETVSNFVKASDSLINSLSLHKTKAFYAGLAQVSKLRVAPFMVLGFKKEIDFNLLVNEAEKRGYSGTQASVNSFKVFSLSYKPQQTFHFLIANGVVVVSTQFIVVESAANADNSSRTFQYFFQNKLSGSENLFVNYAYISSLFNQFLKPDDYLVSKTLNELEGFAAYKFIIEEGNFDIYGSLEKSASRVFGRLKGQTPKESTIITFLPEKVAFASIQAFNSFENWWLSLPEMESAENKLDSVNEILNLNIEQDLVPKLGNEWCLTSLQPVSDDFSLQELLIVKLDNLDEVKSMLNSASQSDSSTKNQSVVYADLEINRLPESPFNEVLFGQVAKRMRHPYYIFYNNHLIMSSFLPGLKVFIDDMLLGEALVNSVRYSKIKDKVTTQLNYLLYINPEKCLLVPKKYLNPLIAPFYHSNARYFSNFETIIYQLVSEGDNFHNHVHISYDRRKEMETEVLWKQKLDAPVAHGPFEMENHNEKKKECLFFDEESNLYLISSSGKRNWKVEMKEPLIGEPLQVDVFKNNKLQYLFATSNHLRLVDRNGNDVGAFPLKLSSKAVVGLSCFDFFNDKKYTIYVGTSNNSVYAYTIEGKPIAGWSPIKLDAPLSMPIQYFVKDGTTYLFGITNAGTLYLWNTNGSQVIKPIETKAKIKNPLRMYFGNKLEDCILVSSDTTGQVVRIKLDGTHTKLKMGSWSATHTLQLEDLNGDSKKDLIFVDKLQIQAYQDNGKKLFTLMSSSGDVNGLKLIKTDKKYQLAYYTSGKQIYVQHTDGSLKNGFPLQGENFILLPIDNQSNKQLITYINSDIISYNIKE